MTVNPSRCCHAPPKSFIDLAGKKKIGEVPVVVNITSQKGQFQSYSDGRYTVDPTKFTSDAQRSAWERIQAEAKSQLENAINGKLDFAPRYCGRSGTHDNFFDPRIQDGRLVPMGAVGNHEFFEEPERERPWKPK